MPGDKKEDELKETQLSQGEQLPYFLSEFVVLVENIEVRGFDVNIAREVIDNFILQVNAINNIREVEGILHNIVMQWRSDLYLFTTDIISPVLFLLERVTNEGLPDIHQHINDILNYLNQNPLYSQNSDRYLSSQGIVQQDGNQEASSSNYNRESPEVREFQYDPSLGVMQFLIDVPPSSAARVEPINYIPLQQATVHFPQAPAHQGSQESGYSVNSQNSSNVFFLPQGFVFQDHQPSPDWWMNVQEDNDFAEEDSDADTVDDGYEEGKTDAETQTQYINFCSDFQFNSLPVDVFNKNSFYQNNNKDTLSDFITNEIPFLNLVNPKFPVEDAHGLQAYDIISLVALISIVSNAMTLIYEG